MQKTIQNYDLEKTNYSKLNYKPDITIQIQRYIRENISPLRIATNRALIGEKILIISPTGSGKTVSIIELLEELSKNGQKSIFIVPNAMQVEQLANNKNYTLKGAYGSDISVLDVLEKANIVAVTWDKFVQIPRETLSEYIVILDEVHQIYTDTYRDEKINKLYERLPYCQGQIHITATPDKLEFDQYNYIVEYNQEAQTNYDVKLYNGIDDKTIFDIIRNCKGKFALLRDKKSFLNLVVENNPSKNIGYIESDTKNSSDAYNEIIENESMSGVDGIVNTTCLVAGVNINEPEITDIIVIGIKDKATIKQYVARFRGLKTVKVHIFNNYKEESKILNVNNLIDIQLEQIREDIEFYNNRNCNKTFTEIELDLKPFVANVENQQFYWSYDESKYVESVPGITALINKNYYSQMNIHQFKVSLEEYFPNIEIVDIKNPNEDVSKVYKEIIKETKNEIVKNILEPNKDVLVGAVEILSNRIGNKLESYLAYNKLDVSDVKSQLLNLGIDRHITIPGIAKTLNLYTKYKVDDSYNSEIAWLLANKHKNFRLKFFGQIRNITYREIESKYPDMFQHKRIEDKLYHLIKNTFKPGISYTNEHIERFVIGAIPAIGINTTSKIVNELLNQMFSIEENQHKKGSKVPLVKYEFLYNTFNTSSTFEKKTNIYTIKNYLTVEDICNQNDLSIESQRLLQAMINDKVKSESKKAETINETVNLAFGKSFSWCS